VAVVDIQKSFDASAVGYISSINSRDLIIRKVNGETEISFAYERKSRWSDRPACCLNMKAPPPRMAPNPRKPNKEHNESPVIANSSRLHVPGCWSVAAGLDAP
jgi:hypothetical protein